MDLDTEIQVKKDLQASIIQYTDLQNDANRLTHRAEEIAADAVAAAKAAGANISFIASATGLSRQKVYILLAMRGMRPGTELVTDGSGANG